MASQLLRACVPSAVQRSLESDRLLPKKMNIASDLKIVRRDHNGSLFRNGGLPLSYTDPSNPSIRICAEGWKKMVRELGYVDLESFFSLKRGLWSVSFAISHETIHQTIAKIAGERVSLELDVVTGGGEFL